MFEWDEYGDLDVESRIIFGYEEDEEDYDEAKEVYRGYLGMGET